MHRDLKSPNIFLTKDGVVKLGDFGVAGVMEHTNAQRDTQVGTPLYMPPEMFQEKQYSTNADIWSLGVLLYEMCALKHPF